MANQSTRITIVGLAVTAWIVHPLTVETVAYAASRGELIAAMGVVGACILATGRWWRGPVAVSILGCLVFGVLGKESAVVGLVLVPLTIWTCQDRWCAQRPSWATPWLPVCLGFLIVALGVWSRGGLVATIEADTPAHLVSAVTWAPAQAEAAVRLLRQVVLPFGLTVDADIDVITPPVRVASLGLLVLLGLGTWITRRRGSFVTYGLAWGLLALVPRLVVQTPRSYLNAHQFYLPLLGFVVVVAVLAARAWVRWPLRTTAVLVLALSVAGALTVHQVRGVWRSPVTLWANAVQIAPLKPRPAVNYGVALLMAGQVDAAEPWFFRAMTLANQPHVPAWDQQEALTASLVNLQGLGLMRTVLRTPLER